MICILEPKSDQALTGSFLFNKEIAAASHGKIERISLAKADMESFREGDSLLLDSAWIYSVEAKLLSKSPQSGFLVHSLPEKVSEWKRPLSECSVLVATSAAVAKRLQTEISDQKIITCLPGNDMRLRSLNPQEREHDLLRLITVANIMPRKGLREAAQFLRALQLEGIDFHWYIAGQPMADRDFNGSNDIDHEYFDDLQSLMDEYEWEDDVSFVGPLTMEQQIRLYLGMDVAFFPSREEDFGKVLLETAQLGLPILTTDVGIARSLFGREDHALILPAPLSQASLRDAKAFLQQYRGLQRNIRQRRSHALLNRSWTMAADELVKSMRTMN